MFEAKLIALYFYICERYEKELKFECQRFSNNSRPVFTDEEVLTLYLFVLSEEKRFKVKDIHCFGRKYLLGWFPRLPSYQAFNNRLMRLSGVLQRLCSELLESHRPDDVCVDKNVLDSMPIIMCLSKRNAKVARGVADKGYCSTKNMYYYGLKLHMVAYKRHNTLPWPESIVISGASDNDLTVFKENWSHWSNRTFYGDKVYNSNEWFEHWNKQTNSNMLTPVKGIQHMPQLIKQRNRAADDLFSRAVSAIRQPIESLFNWLIEKTDIQRASKVRSIKGLLVHVFGKLTAAFIYCIFNP